jgi:hypothetical protein
VRVGLLVSVELNPMGSVLSADDVSDRDEGMTRIFADNVSLHDTALASEPAASRGYQACFAWT